MEQTVPRGSRADIPEEILFEHGHSRDYARLAALRICMELRTISGIYHNNYLSPHFEVGGNEGGDESVSVSANI